MSDKTPVTDEEKAPTGPIELSDSEIERLKDDLLKWVKSLNDAPYTTFDVFKAGFRAAIARLSASEVERNAQRSIEYPKTAENGQSIDHYRAEIEKLVKARLLELFPSDQEFLEQGKYQARFWAPRTQEVWGRAFMGCRHWLRSKLLGGG